MEQTFFATRSQSFERFTRKIWVNFYTYVKNQSFEEFFCIISNRFYSLNSSSSLLANFTPAQFCLILQVNYATISFLGLAPFFGQSSSKNCYESDVTKQMTSDSKSLKEAQIETFKSFDWTLLKVLAWGYVSYQVTKIRNEWLTYL